MNARYILLIQKQFDEELSERETYELQGFLAGNEAAARLCENLRRLLEESENLDLPEQLKPADAENLLREILSAITKTESKSWFSKVKKFVRNKTKISEPNITHADELAVLRKHKAAAEHRSSKAMDALRNKVIAEVAPVTSHDAVSLAVAIKRRMLEPTPAPTTATGPATLSTETSAVLETNPAPTPSISESMDQLFSSSNWPVIAPGAVETSPEQLPEFKPLSTPPPFNTILRNRLNQQQQQEQQQPREEHRQNNAGGTDNRAWLGDDEPVATMPEFPRGDHLQSAQNHPPEQWSAPVPGTSGQVESIWQMEPETQVPFPTWQTEPETHAPVPMWQMEPETQVPVPVWQVELEAQLPEPEWHMDLAAQVKQMKIEPQAPQPTPQREQDSPSRQTEPPIQPVADNVDKASSAPVPHEVLKPSGLIPVDDIIAHVSQIFAEASDTKEDPLGFSSGPYPQVSEIDLRKARAARLATNDNTSESSGQIRGLGKFLLDEQSEAAIGNLSSNSANLSHARILSDEEAIALQECLSPIESLQGVAGCIVLGYDGMIVMNTLPAHADQDALSAWALLTYMNSHELIRVIGHTKLRQFVSRTFSGYLLLADFGQGLLLAVSDNASREAILPLMKSIRKVTAA
ncbi:MAG: hypothetical protein JST44_22155 [Cyanobacteria bacterium SZAS LIN-5]|nr:hypothetical protein [Cyanobacteria bacterium SZAS LIN-5]